jgi:hypothetical protein
LTSIDRTSSSGYAVPELGGSLADQQVVPALDVVDDRLVHLVATDACRVGVDDPGQRNDGNLRRAAPDVDDHVSGRLRYGQSGTNRSRHGLFDQINLPRSRRHCRLADRALFDFGDSRRNRDHDARSNEALAVVHLHDEVTEHRLGDLEVCDDTVFHRPNRNDVARRAPEHLLGLFADGPDFVDTARIAHDCHDAGFRNHDSLALRVDDRVRGSEVDGEIVGEPTEDGVEDHFALLYLAFGASPIRVSKYLDSQGVSNSYRSLQGTSVRIEGQAQTSFCSGLAGRLARP